MIIVELEYKNKQQRIIMTKEKLKQRRATLIKFNKNIQKQVKINAERELKSLKYVKNKIII